MNYWLMKSEPDTFSIQDLQRLGQAGWDGVRNYRARNFLRAMKPGDQALFYHSSTQPTAIVGQMEIVREAHPDPTQFDPQSPYFDEAATPERPRWDQVEVRFVRLFGKPLTLESIRGRPELSGMMLLKQTRLSVLPVTEAEWRAIQASVG